MNHTFDMVAYAATRSQAECEFIAAGSALGYPLSLIAVFVADNSSRGTERKLSAIDDAQFLGVYRDAVLSLAGQIREYSSDPPAYRRTHETYFGPGVGSAIRISGPTDPV